jgi:hypothetical protein
MKKLGNMTLPKFHYYLITESKYIDIVEMPEKSKSLISEMIIDLKKDSNKCMNKE